MPLKRALVGWLDEHAPGVIGSARYHYHVSVAGSMVYPRWSKILFARLDAPRAVAFDVGANTGIFTRYLCRHFASVVSVEPMPYLAERLARSRPRNCRVEPVALGEARGQVTLRIPVGEDGVEMPALSTASSKNDLSLMSRAGIVEREVECKRIDDLVEQHGAPAFVKIDVEGFEGAVLAGGPGLLTDARPVMQIEIARAQNPEYDRMLRTIENADFDIFAMREEGLYVNARAHIERQPLSVEGPHAPADQGSWDFLIVPREKTRPLLSHLIID
jgi:FkbM family methyltransferase